MEQVLVDGDDPHYDSESSEFSDYSFSSASSVASDISISSASTAFGLNDLSEKRQNGNHFCESKTFTCSQLWTIDDFSQFLSDNYQGQYPKMLSNRFSTKSRPDLEFRLDIRPRGDSPQNREYVSLFLSSEGVGKRIINAEMSVIDAQNRKQHTKCCLREDSAASADYGWYRFVSHKDLLDTKNDLLPLGRLNLYVKVNIIMTVDVPKKPTLSTYIGKEKKKLPEVYQRIYLSGVSHDVKLICGRNIIHSHRFILEDRSPVFKAMFHSDMKEKKLGKVVIKGVSLTILQLMIRYIYTNKVEESDLKTHCVDLYKAADLYQLDGLKKICEKALCFNLHEQPELAKEMMTLSELHNLTNLGKNATKIIQKCAINNIKNMDIETMLKLNDYLNDNTPKKATTAETQSNNNANADAPIQSGISRPKRSR